MRDEECVDAFTDFTVNRAPYEKYGGYALLRNGIVRANASCGVTVERTDVAPYLGQMELQRRP